MRVVVTTHTYWPEKNGVQKVTQYLCEGLVKEGFNVIVVTSDANHKGLIKEIHNGVEIERVPLKIKKSFVYSGKRLLIERIKSISENSDCLINVCVQSPINNLLLKHLKEFRNVKKILFLHGMHNFSWNKNDYSSLKFVIWKLLMNIRWGLFFFIHRNDFCQYDGFINIIESSPAVSFFSRINRKAEVFYIHNAADDVFFNTERCLSSYGKYFICVANFIEAKNQIAIIDAFNDIKQKKGYKLILVGNSSTNYFYLIKERIESLRLVDQVLVFNGIDRHQTVELIKNCVCGVLFSRVEVFPVFIEEIMASGHPFISSDVGSIKDMKCGLIAENKNDLSEKMQQLIDDESLTDKLGCICKDYADKNFRISEKIQQLKKVIETIVSE